ncbi:MAG: hypothetical protein AABY13_02370, partial [Nanoarchaeota archaeon]
KIVETEEGVVVAQLAPGQVVVQPEPGITVTQGSGSARLVLDRLTKKVLYVEMNPVFSYEFRTGADKTDFAFRAVDKPGKLFIKRTADQTVPQEFVACQDCGIIDLPEKRIKIGGNVQYLRKWFDATGAALGGDYSVVFHSRNSASLATMALDPTMTFITDLFILGEHPPITTRISNYLTVKEEAVMAATHRLLGINEKLPKEQLAQNLVWTYRTSYSQAAMTINDNNLNYRRGSFVTEVLSPADARIDGLFAGLLAAHASLAVLGLLFIPLRKKAQLSVFILLGLVLLIAVALIYMVGVGKALPVADTSGVNAYVKSCAQQGASEALTYIGAQGGTTTAPLTAWFDGAAQPKSIAEVEDALRSDFSRRIQRCAASIKSTFKGIKEVSTAALDIGATITATDVVFTTHYPVQVTLVDGTQFTLSDQSITKENTLKQTIDMATSAVRSEESYDGFIDLDALTGDHATMTFFPKDQQLVTFIRDDAFAEKGTSYEFAFVSRR